jgi:uncharacterized protein (TIGR02271 family)
MINTNDLASLAGNTMVGSDGSKIGKIVDVYESTEGVDATFVTVSTGLFGGHASFVPLAKADLRGEEVVVPYDKALVKDAPRVAADEELTSEEEDRLYQHYSLTGGGTASAGTGTATTGAAATGAAAAASPGRHAGETAVPRGSDRGDVDGDGVFDDVKDTAVGRDTSGLTTDDAMTRSEERLQVGVQSVEAGRARLRKRIVSETVTQTVPVTHQSAKVVREPITDGNVGQALDGPTLSEEEHEVVLTDTVPLVAKETVAVERVRLGTETVTEQATVSEQVRKENIELDDSEAGRADTRDR